MATTQVKGLAELGRKFKLLSYDAQDKIARAMTNAGAQVMKKAIAKKAPVADAPYTASGRSGGKVTVQPGNLGKQVIVKRLKPSETTASSEHVIIMRGKKKDGYASRIGSLQEFGTVEQPAQPFFRPGATESIDPALNAMKTRFKARIEKSIKDLSK